MRQLHISNECVILTYMTHNNKVCVYVFVCSTVNHPYLKQWAKECVHRSKDDIMAYIMRSLVPVSYPPQQGTSDREPKGEGAESAMTSSEGRQLHESNLSDTEKADDRANSFESNTVGAAAFSSQNGTGTAQKDDSDSPPIDVSSLQLDPLPRSSPSPQLPPTPPENPPDPKSLQLAPLPPLTAEDRSPPAVSEQPRPSPSEKETKQVEGDAGSNVKSPRHPNAGAGVSLEVFNDEFGVQEMSVFATSENQRQVSTSQQHTTNVQNEQPLNPHVSSSPTAGRLISSSRSAFTPVIVTLRDTSSPISTSLSSETTPQNSTTSASREGGNKSADSAAAAGSACAAAEQQKPIKCEYDNAAIKKTLSCLPSTAKSKSGMDSVTLGEFSEAFMKGDTTNWFQRMLLLDHIEAVQDKIRNWMKMIDKQLDGK